MSFHCLGQCSFLTSKLSFSLAWWVRDQASYLSTKSLKEDTKTCPGQAEGQSCLSQGQAGIHGFFNSDECMANFGRNHMSHIYVGLQMQMRKVDCEKS